MLDAISLDQLRTFVAAVDQGSFSAAGRKLFRAQSVVSQTISNLEAQIGVLLFDRKGRYPQLTPQGSALISDVRSILGNVDALKAKAKGMSGGLEPELCVVIDVMFPMAAITRVARLFSETFPHTPLRLHVEALGAVAQNVLSGECSLGVVGSLPDIPWELRAERLFAMLMVMVVAPGHPLGALSGPVPKLELAKHTQIVLTDQTRLSEGRSFGVMSPNTWKLTDMTAKHAFLIEGLGWGGMPMAAVEADIAMGRLRVLDIEDVPPGGIFLPMSVVYPTASPPGPAGRWFVDTLRQCAQLHEREVKSSLPPSI